VAQCADVYPHCAIVIDPIRLGTNAEMDEINEVVGLVVPQQGSDDQDCVGGESPRNLQGDWQK